MSLIFIEKVKENAELFERKVRLISDLLSMNPNWLMFVMNLESSLNHRVVNKYSGATGLIQFMPNTAKSLGTTTEALRAMTNVEQLEYVYKYLSPYKDKLTSVIDLYFTIFFPLAVGKKLDFVIETSKLSASKIAEQNPIFDRNKDGKITKAEVTESLISRIPESWRNTVEWIKKKSS